MKWLSVLTLLITFLSSCGSGSSGDAAVDPVDLVVEDPEAITVVIEPAKVSPLNAADFVEGVLSGGAVAEQTATAVQTTDGREFGLFWMLDLFGRTSFVAGIDQMDHSRWFGPSSDVQSAKFQLLGTICALPPCDGGNQLDVIEPCFVYAPGSDDLSQILIEDPGVNIIAPSKAQGAAVLGDDSMCDSDVDEPENNESLVPIWPIEEEVDGVGYLSGDFLSAFVGLYSEGSLDVDGLDSEEYGFTLTFTASNLNGDRTISIESLDVFIVFDVNMDIRATMSGKIDDSNHGFVECVTTASFKLLESESFPYVGTLRCDGKGETWVELSVIDSVQYQIRADTDGDGIADYGPVIKYWSEF